MKYEVQMPLFSNSPNLLHVVIQCLVQQILNSLDDLHFLWQNGGS